MLKIPHVRQKEKKTRRVAVAISRKRARNPSVKRFVRISLSLLALGVALIVRTSLLNRAATETADDPPVPIELPTEFDPLLAQIELLRPVHEAKRPNQPGDWLERFHEDGQSFPQLVMYHSRKPLNDAYSAIDIQPLGEFDETQRRIIDQTADFMERFFGVSVRIQETRLLEEIPTNARRMRDDVEQLLTTWIMNERLRPQVRPDAMATIALVTCDLWPGNLNWVFGQASIRDRIGVWSLHRNGDPRESEAAYRLCLLRTLKTAVHETGHMLGSPHCVAYECGMNGMRSREENDRRSLEFCPECQAKIWWNCGADPVRRCQSLIEFCEQTGLDEEATFFRKERDVLRIRSD